MRQDDRYPGPTYDEQNVLVIAQWDAMPIRSFNVDAKGFGSRETVLLEARCKAIVRSDEIYHG